MDDIYVVRHVAHTLETAIDLLNSAGIVPAPDRVHIVIEVDDADKVAAWARALFKSGTRTDDAGRVFAERWFDSMSVLRIQANGNGVL